MKKESFPQAGKEETVDEGGIFSSSEKGRDYGWGWNRFLKRETKNMRMRNGPFLKQEQKKLFMRKWSFPQARKEETVNEEVIFSSSENGRGCWWGRDPFLKPKGRECGIGRNLFLKRKMKRLWMRRFFTSSEEGRDCGWGSDLFI